MVQFQKLRHSMDSRNWFQNYMNKRLIDLLVSLPEAKTLQQRAEKCFAKIFDFIISFAGVSKWFVMQFAPDRMRSVNVLLKIRLVYGQTNWFFLVPNAKNKFLTLWRTASSTIL